MSLSPSSSAAEILAHLHGMRSERNIAGMARFGIVTEAALGISNGDLRAIARLVKKDHDRALALFDSGIREALLLAAFTEERDRITPAQARAVVATLKSWETVDSWADTLAGAEIGPGLIPEFAADDREFVRRMAFSMIAWSAVHHKTKPDSYYLGLLQMIEAHATDSRNFVRKAVNWALRQIGKRSPLCHEAALALSRTLAASPDKTARWIGKDAVRELTGAIARGKAGVV